MKATFVRRVDGYRGDARLYRLDPPHHDGTAYVVVSAVDLPTVPGFGYPSSYRTSETMAFAADADGFLTDGFADVAMTPGKDHAECLAELGYTVDAVTE